MNRVETIRCGLIVLIGLLALPGCAVTLRSPATSTITAALSYEVPASVDVKTVVDVLEESSSKILSRPVTIDETTAPLPSTGATSPVILQEHIASLKGLGKVVLPSIICPGALASMHALMPSERGLRLVAGCVVADDNTTRIYLADATAGETRGPARSHLSHKGADASLISRLGEVLMARLPEMHLAPEPNVLIRRSSHRVIEDKTVIAEQSGPSEAVTTEGMPAVAGHAVPFVCFVPKIKGTAVRDNPGSNTVVGTLDSDLIVQEDEPPKHSFLHITTREGRSGWVKRSDVRWTSCPIA